MRSQMTEQEIQEKVAQRMSERNKKADELLESRWSKEPELGTGIKEMYDKDRAKARNLAFALSLQEAHLNRLTETQISTAFQTTPENVMRVVRLAYPNSIRGDVFTEFQMESARDSVYYLEPVYGKTKRGAVAGDVTYESSADRYASEAEVDNFAETPNGTITDFTVTVANKPFRPFEVKIIKDGIVIGNDNGAGAIVGPEISGTVGYENGQIEITLGTAPASGAKLSVETKYVSEDPDQYDNIGSVELKLRDYQFRAKPYKLYGSISKMAGLLLQTTLGIDEEEAMVSGMAEELKKSLDFQAIRTGYRASNKADVIEFNELGAVGESEIDRAQAVTRAINRVSNQMINSLQRGGVSKIVGGPDAIDYLTMHKQFTDAGAQPAVGGHKIGSLKGIDLFKVPADIVPNDELMCVWKNEQNPADVALMAGTLIPLAHTDRMEFKDFHSEQGTAHFGDIKVMNEKYFGKIKIVKKQN